MLGIPTPENSATNKLSYLSSQWDHFPPQKSVLVTHHATGKKSHGEPIYFGYGRTKDYLSVPLYRDFVREIKEIDIYKREYFLKQHSYS